jgi:hypothetical protein
VRKEISEPTTNKGRREADQLRFTTKSIAQNGIAVEIVNSWEVSRHWAGVRTETSVTIVLNPNQEQAIRDAIDAGQVATVEEFIEFAIAGLAPMTQGAASASEPKGLVEVCGDSQRLHWSGL